MEVADCGFINKADQVSILGKNEDLYETSLPQTFKKKITLKDLIHVPYRMISFQHSFLVPRLS